MNTANAYAYTLLVRRNTGDPRDLRAYPGDRIALDHFHEAALATRAFLWAIERETIWNNGTGWHGDHTHHDLSWELYQYANANPGNGKRVAIHHSQLAPLNLTDHLLDELPPGGFPTLLAAWLADYSGTTHSSPSRVPQTFTQVPARGTATKGAEPHGR